MFLASRIIAQASERMVLLALDARRAAPLLELDENVCNNKVERHVALTEFPQSVGGSVTFETSAVVLYAPAASGIGTKVILGPLEDWTKLHLETDYDAFKRAVEVGASKVTDSTPVNP